MKEYVIEGGRPLRGSLRLQGAKNSVLPILAATILHNGTSVLHNCPKLRDVEASVRILRHLGCRAEWEGSTLVVDAATVERWDVPDHLMREMRSSVIFLGAILSRCGKAELSLPGGCELGPRPIDLHLAALRQLGAVIDDGGGQLHCRSGVMRGRELTLSMPSVGATENAILAACGCEGTTVILNAAREPEIKDLELFLCAMGHNVQGAMTSTITVEGKRPTCDVEHTVMPDRIVAATYLCAAAAAGGEVELQGVDYRHLSTIVAALHEAGCHVESRADAITLKSSGVLRSIRPVHTAPYPGFPTDAQAVLMAALLRSRGTTVFVENMFTSRYRHVDELRRMGADVRVEGRVAVVCGVERLRGAAMEATDLRGGAAMVVAALAANGESRVGKIRHIQRGYENIVRDLRMLGAEITEY